ncbi:MAG TPA: hypothetical protein VIB08_02850 [Thermoanaerobaculia bacterium]
MFASCRFATFALSTAESEIAGDMGYLAGTSRVAVSTGGAPPVPEDAGKYLVVLKRTARGWNVAYAIYNSDREPPALPAR